MEVLFEASNLAHFDIPRAIEAEYGGTIGFDLPCVFANFVSSLDGVGAIPDVERSSALISGGDPGDRFVMGLLRACADVVLIGAGTLRAHPTSRWTPEQPAKDHADDLAELRRSLGLSPLPALAVVTASAKLDVTHPGLAEGAIVITTDEGAARLRTSGAHDRLDVVTAGTDHSVEPREVIGQLTARGYRSILTEGGPTLFGELLRAGLVDELFVTISNRIAGRTEDEPRPGIVERALFLPQTLKGATLLSVRRSESNLLLRYAFQEAAAL
jgi:riboflavin biosynthesis pyrimidine reductase